MFGLSVTVQTSHTCPPAAAAIGPANMSSRKALPPIIRESLEQIELVAYKGGTCFLIAITKYFRDGFPDGTRGENWGRAVGGYMLDGCTTRGGIEVGGL